MNKDNLGVAWCAYGWHQVGTKHPGTPYALPVFFFRYCLYKNLQGEKGMIEKGDYMKILKMAMPKMLIR